MTLRQAIVFAILMETNEGILDKAPSYIDEKMRAVENMNEPEMLLDTQNKEKFYQWGKKWGDQINVKFSTN